MTPIHEGQDTSGHFYQYGTTGKKYYFDPDSKLAKERAHEKARKQELAILESRIDRGVPRKEAERRTFNG